MSIEVTARVWQSSRAQGGKLVLLLALADQADGDGIAVLDKPLLAEKCRRSVRWVERTLAELERAGELACSGGRAAILSGVSRTDAERLLRRWEAKR